jgi:hypothetical protein
MFRALLAHPQETLNKRHLVYCVCIISFGCVMNAVCQAPPEDEQVMFETCRGSYFSINWIKSASRWFHYTDVPEFCSCKAFKTCCINFYILLSIRFRTCQNNNTSYHSATLLQLRHVRFFLPHLFLCIRQLWFLWTYSICWLAYV